MIAGSSSQNATGSFPVKRSLFKRPSWSKPEALMEGTDLFHRSNQTYVDHTAEAEHQRKRKLARKERERARRAENEERAGKRQRVSESEDDDDDHSDSDESSRQSEDGNKIQDNDLVSHEVKGDAYTARPKQPEYPSSSLSQSYEAIVAAKNVKIDSGQKTHVSQVIDLEDEDGLARIPRDGADHRITSTKPSNPPMKDDDPVSDEEFPELARQARERARRKRLEENVSSITPDPPPTLQDGSAYQSDGTHQATPSPPPSDPVLQIFINSSIPNTTPLIVNRKLSQRLKDVRLTWVERQHFPTEFADKVFLTWRGKRLFDVTSCRSLGITAGPNGRISAKGDNVVDHEGRIHMEAMTADILGAHKKAKSKDAPKGEEDAIEEPAVIRQKQEAQVKIICKAKGFADFKLIVKPSTMVSKICNAFRSQYQVAPDKVVYLIFDGEKLSDESKIGDTELSDMDTVDVFVRS